MIGFHYLKRYIQEVKFASFGCRIPNILANEQDATCTLLLVFDCICQGWVQAMTLVLEAQAQALSKVFEALKSKYCGKIFLFFTYSYKYTSANNPQKILLAKTLPFKRYGLSKSIL